MKAEFYREQIERLLVMVEEGRGHEGQRADSLPTTSMVDEGWLAREKELFRRLPLLVGHTSEIPSPGDFVVRQFDGTSYLFARGEDGVARAFLNYCRHRGTKLVHVQEGCRKRFQCPYHAWTYGSDGNLLAVPRDDLFPGLAKENYGLKGVHLEEAFGFLWLTKDVRSIQKTEHFLAGLAEEFEALDFAQHHVYFDKTRTLKANWKLPLYAFLESYHVGALHKHSIAKFFVKNVAHTEHHGPHIRSLVPRKTVVDLRGADLSQVHIADYVTPSNIVFPNVCMIAHPTSYSVISMFPGETPGTSTWRHMLLVPSLPSTKAERAHYDKTVKILDGVTYEREDFWVSEQLQEGINVGAVDEMVLARNEHQIRVFHETLEEYCSNLSLE